MPDKTKPTAPTGLAGSAVSSSQINLTCNASTDPDGNGVPPSGIRGYKWFRNGVFRQETVTPAWSATGLSPSTSYQFSVAAVDNAGNQSKLSPQISRTTLSASAPDTTAPSVPTSPAVSVDEDQVTFSWGASTDPTVSGAVTSGVAGYNVKRDGVLIAVTSDTSYVDANLAPGAYEYTVNAEDNAGNPSAYTSPVSAQVVLAFPACPDNFQASGLDQDTIRCTWQVGTDGATPTAHRIYGSETGAAGTFSLYAEVNMPALSHDLSGYAPETTRFLRARGLNVASGQTSTSVTPTVQATTTSAPSETIRSIKKNGTGNHTTIAAALAATMPGEIAEIQDSGTYNEAIVSVRAGNVVLRAAAGFSPVVTGIVTRNGESASCHMEHDGNIFGEGIELRGTNAGESSYLASGPERGCYVTGDNCTPRFKVRDVRFDFIRVNADRTRVVGADGYHCGAWDRGDGQDAGNGMQSSEAATNTLIEDSRFATGGHDALQVFGQGMLVKGSMITNDWSAYVGAGKGNRTATFSHNATRLVLEDSLLHTALIAVDASGAAGVKNMTKNSLWRRFFILNVATNGAGIACLSPAQAGDGGDPGASDQRYAHFTIWSCTAEGLSFIDNNGQNFGPFRFKNGIFANLGSARGIDFQYRGGHANATRKNWQNLLFIHNCVFDANYPVRIQDKDGVNTTINSTISALAAAYPANFSGITIASPGFASAAVPVSTVPATALDQAIANFTPSAAQVLGDGAPLTTANGAVSNSPTVVVADAKWFRDAMGWAHLVGDDIYIAGAGARRITAINYTTNTLTLDANVTCANGAGVFLGSSATPNIGAV